LSTLRRISLSLLSLLLALAACSPEQSQNLGAQPKKTLDSVNQKLDAATQKDADRLNNMDEQAK
jgi:hypothetical protein